MVGPRPLCFLTNRVVSPSPRHHVKRTRQFLRAMAARVFTDWCSCLQFEGGVFTTAMVLDGAYKLSAATKLAPTLTEVRHAHAHTHTHTRTHTHTHAHTHTHTHTHTARSSVNSYTHYMTHHKLLSSETTPQTNISRTTFARQTRFVCKVQQQAASNCSLPQRFSFSFPCRTK